ncbi:uncharacterized protein PHACADRAFT_254863, partial [Phanerochaete carnosa HHB-10118-sp]
MHAIRRCPADIAEEDIKVLLDEGNPLAEVRHTRVGVSAAGLGVERIVAADMQAGRKQAEGIVDVAVAQLEVLVGAEDGIG